MTSWPVHATISGPIVMIGFGSIGQLTLRRPANDRGVEIGLPALKNRGAVAADARDAATKKTCRCFASAAAA